MFLLPLYFPLYNQYMGFIVYIMLTICRVSLHCRRCPRFFTREFLKMIDVQLILRDCLIKPSDWSVEISDLTAVAEVKDRDYAQDHP